MSTATRHPLSWPAGRPRTPADRRARAKFHTQTRRQGQFGVYTERSGVSLADARDELFAELGRLGARQIVLSTNLELRLDGLPRAGQRQPEDPGVAVYFAHDGREMCFACDRWTKVEDNLVAVAKTIEALRGISRWGTGEMVQAAFAGFAALPAARTAIRRWHEVLGVSAHAPTDHVTDAYRKLAKDNHPDRGGEHERMLEINDAYERFKKERGL